MALTRRSFIHTIGASALGSVSAKLEGVSALIDAATSSTGALQVNALKALLLKRGDLMVTSKDDMDLMDLNMHFSDMHDALQNKYLAPLDWDPSLLTQAESKAFTEELSALKAEYLRYLTPLKQQVKNIDAALRKSPQSLGKLLAPRERYDEMVHNISLGPQHLRDSRIASLGDMPLSDIDSSVLDDARALAEGSRPDFIHFQNENAAETIANVDNSIMDVTKAATLPRNDRWKKKRDDALRESLSETLHELAIAPQVRIESSLTKGYGADNWLITTRFKHDDIGQSADTELQFQFNDLANILNMAYPERPDLIKHGRPLQPGYGEHDCERFIIEGPDFRLREVLKGALSEHLSQKNQTTRLAR